MMELGNSSDIVTAADRTPHEISSISPPPAWPEDIRDARREANVHGLCQKCESFVTWFFLNPSRQAIKAGLQRKHLCKIYLAGGGEACHLCTFLRNMTSAYRNSEWAMTYQKLRTGPYELYIYQTNLTFYPAGRTDLDNAMIFYVGPHNAIHSSGALKYNGCFIPTTPRPNALSARPLQPRINVAAIKEWIQVCEQKHTACCDSSSGPALSGLKVIDCESRTIAQMQQRLPYVTLSYLWGERAGDSIQQP
jgi:hypothetical protein